MFTTQFKVTARNPWRTYPTTLVIELPDVTKAAIFFPLFALNFPEKWQMGFQTPGTVVMEKIVGLHHDVMFFLIIIVFFVGWMLTTILDLYAQNQRQIVRVAFSHDATVERI